MDFMDYAASITERLQSNMEARAVEQGYIDPNQFPNEYELATLEPRVDECGPLEDVIADAQDIANKYGIQVKVDVRQFDEDAGLDWGHRTLTIQPNGGR